MDILTVLILGILEGVTEFLPISSTGHLILANRLLGLASVDFLKTFEVAIQSGAILAVLVLYGRKLAGDWSLLKKIATAFIPTAILGLVFRELVFTLLGKPQVVVWSLVLGGVVMLIWSGKGANRADWSSGLAALSYRRAFFIGVIQAVAIIPGVSRAAATILGGLWLGLNRQAAVQFSFLLAVPTIIAASGLALVREPLILQRGELVWLMLGLVTALLTALLTIRWLLRFINRHSFAYFGIYRIIVGVVFLWFFI